MRDTPIEGALLNKVPALTRVFWLIKILSINMARPREQVGAIGELFNRLEHHKLRRGRDLFDAAEQAFKFGVVTEVAVADYP